MAFTLGEVFEDIPVVKVVDVGASPIDGTPIYEPLRASGGADVVGFEPASDQYARLLEMNLPRSTFLPDAIGDGQEGELKVCRGPGMTSLLEPDLGGQVYSYLTFQSLEPSPLPHGNGVLVSRCCPWALWSQNMRYE